MRARDVKLGVEYAISSGRSSYYLDRAIRGVVEDKVGEGRWRVRLNEAIIKNRWGGWHSAGDTKPDPTYGEVLTDEIEVSVYELVAPWEKHLVQREETKCKEVEVERLDELEREEATSLCQELPEALIGAGCSGITDNGGRPRVREEWGYANPRGARSKREIQITLTLEDTATLLQRLQLSGRSNESGASTSASALGSLLQYPDL